ncbi:hypothetical protein [Clostridium sp. KNHs216]|uniref:hypothetical protein n=1 Tax=Clostridium sp. KNHs216 TaxID=1550235 RepID=UPI0011514F1D|nr:hypothetical protein [Clostridium sp. KNHs216]TQI66791.1 hypothetical protein LY85_1467 [Clostridium sp. KNHs216]
MRESMLHFGGTFGKRFTRKQKDRFIGFITKIMKELGYKVRTVTEKRKFGGNSVHVLIGNVEKAGVVFVSSYDTASRILFPNYRYYPLDRQKNFKNEKRNSLLQYGIAGTILLICFLIAFFSGGVLNGQTHLWRFLALAVAVFGAFRVASGIPNKFNFNRNTSSLLLIGKLASTVKNRKKAAFVLADFSCNYYEGYRELQEFFGKELQSKKVVVLDCVGTGAPIYFAERKGRPSNDIERLKQIPTGLDVRFTELTEEQADDSVLYFFPDGVYVFSAQQADNRLFVPDTRTGKDSRVDFEQLEMLQRLFEEYLR